jgi:hypothetical protein
MLLLDSGIGRRPGVGRAGAFRAGTAIVLQFSCLANSDLVRWGERRGNRGSVRKRMGFNGEARVGSFSSWRGPPMRRASQSSTKIGVAVYP